MEWGIGFFFFFKKNKRFDFYGVGGWLFVEAAVEAAHHPPKFTVFKPGRYGCHSLYFYYSLASFVK